MHQHKDMPLDDNPGKHQHEGKKPYIALYGNLQEIRQDPDKDPHEAGDNRPLDPLDVLNLFFQFGQLFPGKGRLYLLFFLYVFGHPAPPSSLIF